MAPASNRSLLLPLGIIATILVGWVLKVAAPIIQPLVIALLLAQMLSPIVRFLARFRVPPIVSVLALAGLLLYGAVVGLNVAQKYVRAFIDEASPAPVATAQRNAGGADVEGVGDGVGDGAVDGARDVAVDGEGDLAGVGEGDLEVAGEGDEAIDAVATEPEEETPALDVLLAGISARLAATTLPAEVKNSLQAELKDIKEQGRAEGYAREFLQSGVSLSRTFILVLIYMLFIFAEQVVFRRKMLAVAGDRREEAARVIDTIGRGIQRFVGIKTLTSLATGALAYAVLVGVGVPYALPFAILTFVFNFVPYFGSLIAGALPTVTALAVGDTWVDGVVVAVAYFLINTLIGSYVEPKILGRELDLSPLVIIVSVVVWTALWGVVGALLAVPLMATLQIVLASIETTRPIAVVLSSGPPKEGGRRPLRRIA
ncbi:AI-2 transport protein TqsA [Planctomycetes bacterium Pla163]|uniref:AI-2 transport protein TqsA n=1 Tax=Rohdeia mirabilis TaxID=2528008 RepID=A0A518CZ31_9BACT|nr:AI-2 transport protein TqsA [Planctomycetes bacterium Pla163]